MAAICPIPDRANPGQSGKATLGTSCGDAMADHPNYRLTFTLLPGREWPPAPERLTWLLTHARRRCGLRCTQVEELRGSTTEEDDPTTEHTEHTEERHGRKTGRW